MDLSRHKSVFGTIAENYQQHRTGYNKKLYDFIFSVTVPHPVILDVGCGTGKSTEPLTLEAQSVIGVDPDDLMLEQARIHAKKQNLSINYAHGSAEKLPFKEEMFDAVVAGRAFHWFATTEALREIRRVTKSDAPFFVFWTKEDNTPEQDKIDPSLFKKYNWQTVPEKLWDQQTIKKLLEENQYRNVITKNIPNVVEFNLEERVGLETTSSTFALLSEKEKISFIKDIKNDLSAKLGDRDRFQIKQNIKVVYGFK